MPLPVVGVFAWFIGLFTSAFTSFATWLVARMVYAKAVHYALVTAFVVAAAALTVSISVSIKAAVFAARIFMPEGLGNATYFLPSNINTIIALIVTIRVGHALYRWTVRVMAAYLPTNPSHGLML